MPRSPSPTLLVLREIRDELRQHRDILREHGTILREHGTILREHGTILHEHTERLSALERRQVETEIRLATELVAVTGAVREVRDLLRDRLVDPERVGSLERRVDALERRMDG